MAEEQNTGIKGAVPSEPCLATVISHLDTTYMGSLEVKILRPGAGNDTTSSQVQQVVQLLQKDKEFKGQVASVKGATNEQASLIFKQIIIINY